MFFFFLFSTSPLNSVGRVPVMFVTYALAGLTGIFTYFSGGSFELFVITRFVMGFVLLSISITPFVLGMYLDVQKFTSVRFTMVCNPIVPVKTMEFEPARTT